MSVVLDTGFVVALMDAGDGHHEPATRWIDGCAEDLITTPLALAEMDHFASSVGGPAAADRLWQQFEVGAFHVRWWASALAETIRIARENRPIGLADASLVALAGDLRTTRVATFDHRHFRALTTPNGEHFTVLPADAP